MENENRTPFDTFNLAVSSRGKGDNHLARRLFEGALNEIDDASLKARCFLALGQLAELQRNYEVALDFYEKGLALQITEKFPDYFLNNNSGYSLNMLARHQEAEARCRKAIAIDPTRHNGWKNLGICLEAKGDAMGAASAYVQAVKLEPRDARAYVLLERLIDDNPESRRLPGILSDKAACLAAIMAAIEPKVSKVQTTEICRLKHVRGMGYFKLEEGIESPISPEEVTQAYGLAALTALDNCRWVSIVTEDAAGSAQPKATSTESLDLTPYVIIGKKSQDR